MKKIIQPTFKLAAIGVIFFALAACQSTRQGSSSAKDTTVTTNTQTETKTDSARYAVTATGTIGEITSGKDGYMAALKGDDGKEYMVTLSVMRLEKNYVRFNTGDHVQVAGDTIHLENKVNILAKEAKKLN